MLALAEARSSPGSHTVCQCHGHLRLFLEQRKCDPVFPAARLASCQPGARRGGWGRGGGAQHYGSCLSQRGAEHRAPVLPIPKHFALPAVGCGLWARLCCVLLPRPTCGNGHGAASWGGGRGQIPAGGHPAVCPTQHCCTPRGLRGSTAGGVGSFRAHSHPSSLSVFPKAAGIPLWRRSSARPSWELW